MRCSRCVAGFWLALAACAAAFAGEADTVLLTPTKDNSVYSEEPGYSNGAGSHLFAGRTLFATVRRGLLHFDVASAIPAGSTIVAIRLELFCSLNPPGAIPRSFGLHRLTADWGEGLSVGPGPGGTGAPAQPGDATWDERFYGEDAPWTAPGGDFAAAASATFQVGACSEVAPVLVAVASTAQLVADVQAWVDDPASQFGWILLGNEASNGSARRFQSREATTGQRPRLIVEYFPPWGPVGQVPDGGSVPGTPLTVSKLPDGRVALSWGQSCFWSDEDYAVYEGAIGSYYGHERVLCGTGGVTTATISPVHAGAYFLVSAVGPLNEEGSAGRASNGNERPPGSPACFPRSPAPVPCP